MSWCPSECWCGNPHPRNWDEATNWNSVKKSVPPCLCAKCEDRRVLAVADEYGGSHVAARLESAVYKARLRDAESPDPLTREMAKSLMRGRLCISCHR